LEALWPTTSDRSVANCQTMTPCRRRPRTSSNATSNQYQKGSSNRFHATTQTLRLQPRRLYKTSTAQHKHGKPKHSKIWPSASTAAPLAWPPETTLRNSTVRVGQANTMKPGALELDACCSLQSSTQQVGLPNLWLPHDSRLSGQYRAVDAVVQRKVSQAAACWPTISRPRPDGPPSTGHQAADG